MKMAKFEAPGIKAYDFMMVWILKNTFAQKQLMESKVLLSSNIFHRYPLYFPKIQTDILFTVKYQEPQAWLFWYVRNYSLSISGIL